MVGMLSTSVNSGSRLLVIVSPMKKFEGEKVSLLRVTFFRVEIIQQ